MSNEEFENYIALVSRLLQLRGKQREQISVELRDHLQTRAAELESQGENKQASLRQAIEEFGDAAAMAKNFQSVHNLKRRRWMMRFTTFAIAGVFLAALFTMSMWPGNARFGAPEISLAAKQKRTDRRNTTQYRPVVSEASKRDAATAQALEKVGTLEYHEIQVSDVLTELSENLNVNFMLHTSAIDDSLTNEELITVNLKNIPLAKGLELMLAPYNATYTIDEGIVVLVSKDEADTSEFMRIKMFDCKSLCLALPSPRKSMAEQAQKVTDRGDTELAKEPAAIEGTGEDTLLMLVHTLVEPSSWGKGKAEVEVVKGFLVVKQTESALRDIGEMLRDLRGKVFNETEAYTVERKVTKATAPNAKEGKVKTATKEEEKDESQKAVPVSNGDANPFG